MHNYVTDHEIRDKLHLMTRQLKFWTAEIETNMRRIKFDPNQPRVPAGNDRSGEWTDTGAGGGTSWGRAPTLPRRKPSSLRNPLPLRLRPAMTQEELRRFNESAPPGTSPEDLEIDPDFGLPRWYVEGSIRPSESPLDLIGAGGAIRAAATVAKTTVTEASSVVRVLRSRIIGQRTSEDSNTKIKNAADAVENFLGGRPTPKDVKINPKGDIIILRENKKFRMDLRAPGDKPGPNGTRVPEDPHFHLQEYQDGEWMDAGDIHRFFFKK